jgi:hypothetical protein
LIGHDAGAVAKVRWAWGEYVARADSSDPQVAPARETLQQLKD